MIRMNITAIKIQLSRTLYLSQSAYSLYIYPLTRTAEKAHSYDLVYKIVVYLSKNFFFLRTQLKSLFLQKVFVLIPANREDIVSRASTDSKSISSFPYAYHTRILGIFLLSCICCLNVSYSLYIFL